MGRLFWKFFFAFWLALLTAGLGVGVAVWLHNRPSPGETPGIDRGPPAMHLVRAASLSLQYGGLPALEALLGHMARDPMMELYAVDESGRDLLGRPVSPAALAEARERAGPPAGDDGRPPVAVEMAGANGHDYLFFVMPREEGARAMPPPHRRPPSPLWPITAGILASLLFSALLAWYLSKPIRRLGDALGAAAKGNLKVRVAPQMGRRRDELADLGRAYDHMAERLRILMEAQRRLLHDVSHELRSPLARLQAAIGLARQDPGKMETTLDRVERESVRLDDLVGQLLTLSRLEAGTAGTARESIDLVELAEAIAEDGRFEALAAGRELHFHGEGQAQAEVQVELLSRAMENVIRNGVKYTAEGTAVEVAAGLTADGEHFRLAVMDLGPGVPDQDLEAIFEPFYRGRNGRSASGYGLGLTIAIRALEAHGGTVKARNREDGGLVVELVLPLVLPLVSSPVRRPGSEGNAGG